MPAAPAATHPQSTQPKHQHQYQTSTINTVDANHNANNNSWDHAAQVYEEVLVAAKFTW